MEIKKKTSHTSEQSAANLSFSKKVLLSLKKTYFEVKKSIFARRARITSVKREVLSAGVGF